jgi:hypothetical protein
MEKISGFIQNLSEIDSPVMAIILLMNRTVESAYCKCDSNDRKWFTSPLTGGE